MALRVVLRGASRTARSESSALRSRAFTSIAHRTNAAATIQSVGHVARRSLASAATTTSPRSAPAPAAAAAPPSGGDASQVIFDIQQENDFKTLVMDSPVPVLLDCWAAWCGPCRTLGPILEAAVKAQGGKVRMVKLDTDKQPRLAQSLKVTQLPTVLGVVNGKLVEQFIGVQPEAKIKEFIGNLLKVAGGANQPTGRLEDDVNALSQGIVDALTLLKATPPATKEQIQGEIVPLLQMGAGFTLPPAPTPAPGTPVSPALAAERRKLEDSVENFRALAYAGLLRCALLDGETEAVQGIAKAIRSTFPRLVLDGPEIKAALALAALSEGKAEGGADDADSIPALEKAVLENPASSKDRYDLAKSYFAKGRSQEAIDQALILLKKDRAYNEGAPRLLLLDIFSALGPTSELVKEGRKRMTSILLN